jgi:hypothetical protein
MSDNQIVRFKKFQRNSEQSLNKLLEVNGFSSKEDFKNKVKILNTYSETFGFENVSDNLTATNIQHVSDMYDKYDAYINFIEEIGDILVDITDISGFSYSVSSSSKMDKVSSITLNIEKKENFKSMDIKKVISKIDVINSTMGVEFTLYDINMSEIWFILTLIKSEPKKKKKFVDDDYSEYFSPSGDINYFRRRVQNEYGLDESKIYRLISKK